MATIPPTGPTTPLTFDEWHQLANLVRRFEVHHTKPDSPERATAAQLWQHVRGTYGTAYVQGD